jgi:hypothetical protein
MWDGEEIDRVRGMLLRQLGKLYELGAKWPVTDTDPQSAIDCSGLSRWIIAQGRDRGGRQVILPHGSYNQIRVCKALGVQRPLALDLGFAALHGKEPDHVVVRYDDMWVIEARGKQPGHDYDKVIKRPAAVWDAQKGFLGWWRVPGIYD